MSFFSWMCLKSYDKLLEFQDEVKIDLADTNTLIETIEAMRNNTNYSSSCVQYHKTIQRLQEMIINQRQNTRINTQLEIFRLWISLLSILNSIISILIFRGLKLITKISLFSSIIIHVSCFITSTRQTIILELSVTFVTFIVFIKSSYAVSHVRRNRKKKTRR